MANLKTDSGVVAVEANKTANWYAWNNLMPPPPPSFHIIGEVEVPNPGVDVFLFEHVPQGTNPKILRLDLVLVQRPGVWPQLVVRKQVRFDKYNAIYDQVVIFSDGAPIAEVPVNNIF
jgi:hypothetical protein